MKFTKAMLDFGLSFHQPTKKERQELNASYDLINLPFSDKVLLFAEMFGDYPITLYEAESIGILEVWFAWPYPERDEFVPCLKFQNTLIMRDPNPLVVKPIAYRLDRNFPGHQPILDFFDSNIRGSSATLQTYEHPPSGLFDGLTDLDRLDDNEIRLSGIDLIEWEPVRLGNKQPPEPGYSHRWLLDWRELIYPTPKDMKGRQVKLFHEIRSRGLEYCKRLFLNRLETFNLIRDHAELFGQQTNLIDNLSPGLTYLQRSVNVSDYQLNSFNASVENEGVLQAGKNSHRPFEVPNEESLSVL